MGWIAEHKAILRNKYSNYVSCAKQRGLTNYVTYTEFKDLYVYNTDTETFPRVKDLVNDLVD